MGLSANRELAERFVRIYQEDACSTYRLTSNSVVVIRATPLFLSERSEDKSATSELLQGVSEERTPSRLISAIAWSHATGER